MISGIYQLTFPDGSRYIGKSINIEERWKQHTEKLKNGKAAKNMQVAWDRWQEFEAEVLFECHPDHIDIMEETLIARCNPELNTTRPMDRLPGISGEEFDNTIKLFKYSTLNHIKTLREQEEHLLVAQRNIEHLEEEVEELGTQRNEEEILADVNNRIGRLEIDCEHLNNKNKELIESNKKLKQQLEYANRPWWKKLFG